MYTASLRVKVTSRFNSRRCVDSSVSTRGCILLGHRIDVGDVLAALDLFVVCSDQEGMANAMLEAMAAGVPVVSTPVSGAQEALRPLADGRQPGRVLALYAYNEMTGTVRDLLSKPPVLRLMAEAAQKRTGAL